MGWIRAALAAAVATVALSLVATPAWAHNALRSSSPADGEQLAAPPRQVVLEFRERLDPKFTVVAITGPGGPVTGEPVGVDGVRAVQPLPATLPDGRYTVAYRVVSVDGHPVQGQLSFTVAAPAAAPSPTPVSPIAATAQAPVAVGAAGKAAGGTSGGSSTAAWSAAGLAAVALAAGAGWWAVRRARTGRS
nr:copper resistance CopC family protein [Planosporangium flavigriseum]